MTHLVSPTYLPAGHMTLNAASQRTNSCIGQLVNYARFASGKNGRSRERNHTGATTRSIGFQLHTTALCASWSQKTPMLRHTALTSLSGGRHMPERRWTHL